MTYLYKDGKIVCVELKLQSEKMIYIKEVNVNIEVTVRRFKGNKKMKVFIASDKLLTIPQYMKLQQMIKNSWREHESNKRRDYVHKERKKLVTA